jgi:hypothetical protein
MARGHWDTLAGEACGLQGPQFIMSDRQWVPMMLKRESALDLIRHLLAVLILLVAPPP